MQTKRQIQELLESAGVAPNRRLGQHFLVDLNLMRLLVDSAQIDPQDVVLEVGPGTGSLTEALAERAGQVVSAELDTTLAQIAISRLAHAANVQILNTDALSSKGSIAPDVVRAVETARAEVEGSSTGILPVSGMGVPPMNPMGIPRSGRGQALPPNCHGQDARVTHGRDGRATGGPRVVLVANLPYDVASPVMINLVKGPLVVDAMCVTVQKEVAQRMIARPGGRDYGTLSIFLQATGEVEMLRTLPPGAFWPPPQVDSAIVRYRRDSQKSERIANMDLFGAVVGLFIGHRRKMLRACVKQAPPELGGREVWPEIFERLAIDPTRRPEEISPDQYVDMATLCGTLRTP